MGRGRIQTIAILLIAAVLISVNPGCSWFDVDHPLTSFTQAIPEDFSNVTSLNLSLLKNDNDIDSLYYDWAEEWEDWLEPLGIDYRDIQRISFLGGADLVMIEGPVDRRDIRDKLDSLEYDDGKYLKQEQWSAPNETKWVALRSDFILIGNETEVKLCLDLVGDGPGTVDSLWDDGNVQEVLKKLPNGVSTMIGLSSEMSEAIRAWGYVWESDGGGTLALTAVYVFDGTGRIESTRGDLEEYWEEERSHYDVDVSSSGVYVKVTGKIEKSDLEDLLLVPSEDR
jgi:hypothetical protein